MDGATRVTPASLHTTKDSNPTPTQRHHRPRQRQRLRPRPNRTPPLRMREVDRSHGARLLVRATVRDRRARRDGIKYQRNLATTSPEERAQKGTSAILTIVRLLEVSENKWRRQGLGHRPRRGNRRKARSYAEIWLATVPVVLGIDVISTTTPRQSLPQRPQDHKPKRLRKGRQRANPKRNLPDDGHALALPVPS